MQGRYHGSNDAARWQLLRSSILILGALVVGSSALSAQCSQLAAGARVRLRAPSILSGEVRGDIVARPGDTIVFAPRGKAPIRLALTDLTAAGLMRGAHL